MGVHGYCLMMGARAEDGKSISAFNGVSFSGRDRSCPSRLRNTRVQVYR